MTKASVFTTTGTKDGEVELPIVFSTPFRKELIHKAFTNLTSHKFQPQGRHPTAGQDVVADSNDPPTGQGVSRVARMQGGGGGRQGQGAEVASTSEVYLTALDASNQFVSSGTPADDAQLFRTLLGNLLDSGNMN